MKKNMPLLALVLSTVLVSSATTTAHAGVKLFGSVQAEYSSIKINATPVNQNTYTQNSIEDNGVWSRWGVLVNERLSNGLRAIAKIEYFITPPNNAPLGNREQWVGLAGPWGRFMAGRVLAPMTVFGGARYDIFVDTALQARGSGGAMYAPFDGFGAAAFVDHALRYISPVMHGFQFAALVMPSNAAQASAPNDSGGKGGAPDWNLAARYDFGRYEVIAGYSLDKASDAQKTAAPINGRTAHDEKVWRLGGKVGFGPLTLLGQYEHIVNALSPEGAAGCAPGGAFAGTPVSPGVLSNPYNPQGGTAQCNTAMYPNGDGHIWFLAAHYRVGNTVLVLQGGATKARGFNGLRDQGAKDITVGAVYFFSKRTRLYGGYQRVNVDQATTNIPATQQIVHPDRSTLVMGVREDF